MSKSDLEAKLAFQIRVAGLPEPEREYQFAKSIGRRWRFDFAYVDCKWGIEVDGGVYSGGRHTRGSGFTKDCEKMNSAAILGWRVLRFTGAMVYDGSALQTLEWALAGEANE